MLYWSSMYRLCLLLLAQTLIGSFAYIVFVNAAMFMQGLHRLGSCFGGNGIRFHNQNYWMCHCPNLRTVLQCDRCFFPPHKATKHTMNADIYFLSRNQRSDLPIRTAKKSKWSIKKPGIEKNLALRTPGGAIMWFENKQSKTRWPYQERERQKRGRKSEGNHPSTNFLKKEQRERGLELCFRIIYIARGRMGLREAEICFGQTTK